MAKVWDKPITADTDWGGDASTDNLPVSGRQVQAWIKGNIKSDAQISQLLVSWLNANTINSPVFWKGLPIDADTLKWEDDKLTVVGSNGEDEVVIDEEFLLNFLTENGYLTKGDYPFVYDAEKKAWLFTGDLVATGAITMFGDFNKFKPSTIMDAVMVDGITIDKTAEGVLFVKGGGGSGGSGLSYEEINQIVNNAIQNKADKATTLEGYGIEDAYDKSYIDTLAYKLTTVYNWGDHSKAGYLIKDTPQDIYADKHNFVKGLKIGGLELYKSKDDVLFLDANLVVRGAITMYGDNGTTSKTIWESIPFNQTQMKWENGVWNIIGGTGGTDENAVKLLIGEALVPYIKAETADGKYALISTVSGINSRLSAVETFFATDDTDNLVNKWSEIVTFLNATEGDTLDNILKTKANQSALDAAISTLNTEIGKKWTQDDAKIANWDKAYGWGNHANAGYAGKSYVDTELAKYVKLATAQSISAQHDFTNGIKVGGLPITKKDGVLYLDANVVVSGAITMFGSGSITFPTIWANIPFDSSMKWDGSKWSVVGGGSGGGVDANAVNVLINEYLTTNKYATQSWVQSQGYLTQHQSLSHLLSKTDAANTYQPIINSSNKLAYSLISGAPTKLSQFTDDIVAANYLSKKGGAIQTAGVADFTIYRTNGVNSVIHFYNTQDGNMTDVGYLGAASNGRPVYLDSGGSVFDLLHSGNYSDYFTKANIKSTLGISDWALAATKPSYTAAEVGALSASGGTVSGTEETVLKINTSYTVGVAVNFRVGDKSKAWVGYNTSDGAYLGDSDWGYTLRIGTNGKPYYRSYELIHSNNIGSYNAGSATKLQTARTIWGQSFDGTGNVDGKLQISSSGNAPLVINQAYSAAWANAITLMNGGLVKGQHYNIDFGVSASAKNAGWIGFYYNSWGSDYNRVSLGLNSVDDVLNILGNGNVAIGRTTADAKLHVGGSIYADYDLVSTGTSKSAGGFNLSDTGETYCGLMPNRLISSSGQVTDMWLYNNTKITYYASAHEIINDVTINGNLLTTGAITMFSQASLKNIVDERGLSLDELATIKPTRFYWKDGRDDKLHVGGIADEVIKVLPEAIYHTSDGTMTMDYGSAAFYVGASLIKPVIDHEKRIADLERENAELKREVQQLRLA